MQKTAQIKVDIITGPTCCGKTKAALELAEKIGAEIISCDSVLVYRGMDIGSAKPSKEELARVRHHLIDVADVSDKFDVARYVGLARKALAEISARGGRVVVAGGSGFYLRAWFSAVADNVEIPPEVKKISAEIFEKGGDAALKDALLRLDPRAAECVDILNPRRVKNAFERCLASGKSAAEILADFKKLPCPFGELERNLTILDLPDAELFPRIRGRAARMVDGGIVEETRALIGRGLLENPSARTAIGYRETIEWLESGASSADELKEKISSATIALVKKQRKFFRNNLLK